MLTPLTSLSPLDGRYREKLEDLSQYFSEFALIKTRAEVEARYLIALSEARVIRKLTSNEKKILLELGPGLTLKQAENVKKTEREIRHDMKSVELTLKNILNKTTLKNVTGMIHFGLTSEDVNNISYRLMTVRSSNGIIIPALQNLVNSLCEKAEKYKSMPILARSHGQPAVPTTFGKEFVNTAVRLNIQLKKLREIRLTGKLNGAVGNFNAHTFALPGKNWIHFSQRFVKSFGFIPGIYTTQINPHEDMIELLQLILRINGIILDVNQDMWRYISDGWLIQNVHKNEVGSSTMPHKVNPIDFENSEGNLQIANSLIEGVSRKLAVSRLQRDLSDSTTVRNYGIIFGYSLLGYKSTSAGLAKVRPDEKVIANYLNTRWSILSEAAQTILRYEGVKNPYELAKEFSRGKDISKKEWLEWVSTLPVKDSVKEKLSKLTPQSYIGLATVLTEMALKELRTV